MNVTITMLHLLEEAGNDHGTKMTQMNPLTNPHHSVQGGREQESLPLG